MLETYLGGWVASCCLYPLSVTWEKGTSGLQKPAFMCLWELGEIIMVVTVMVKMGDHLDICSCQLDVPFTNFCVVFSMSQQLYVPLNSKAQGTLIMCLCLLVNSHDA